MRVLFCGTGWLPIVDFVRERLPTGVRIEARDPDLELLPQLEGAHVILPSNARIKAEHFDAAPGLVLVQQPAVGYNGIDLEAAEARGLPVCNAPGTNGQALAEATIFVILGVARRVLTAQANLRKPRLGVPVGRELADKRLLLIGHGDSGKRVESIAHAIGAHVEFTTSTTRRAELLERLSRADIVSIHCPLNRETRHMFDAEAFSAMRPGCLLVNCARGPIVDRAALDAALASGRLGGFGIDAYWREPWDPDDPLLRNERVFAMPHIGGSTEEAFSRIADICADNIRRIRSGEPLQHRLV